MRHLTDEILSEPDGFVVIRAAAPGHIYAELVRENKDPLIAEGADVEDALLRLDDGVLDELLYEESVSA